MKSKACEKCAFGKSIAESGRQYSSYRFTKIGVEWLHYTNGFWFIDGYCRERCPYELERMMEESK